MPHFEVIENGKKLLDVEYEGKELVIGREPAAQVRLKDPIVSRRHARAYGAGGVMILEDLGTVNGTFVNGRREYRVPLADGDVIEFGAFHVRYHQTPLESVATAHVEELLKTVAGELVVDDSPLPVGMLEGHPMSLEARSFDYAALASSFQQLEDVEREEAERPDGSGGTTRHIAPGDFIRLRREKHALLEPHLVQHKVTPLRIHALKAARNAIGTGEQCQLKIAETGGEELAVFERRGDGGFTLKKQGLLARVRVNGTRIQRAPLNEGDLVEIGGAVFTYREGA